MSNTVTALKCGEAVDFEGLKLRMAPGELQPGDIYIGERNQGPKLLTVGRIVFSECSCHGYVIPADDYAYCYDFPSEVVKVCEA